MQERNETEKCHITRMKTFTGLCTALINSNGHVSSTVGEVPNDAAEEIKCKYFLIHKKEIKII